jgi:hypothetical protein
LIRAFLGENSCQTGVTIVKTINHGREHNQQKQINIVQQDLDLSSSGDGGDDLMQFHMFNTFRFYRE